MVRERGERPENPVPPAAARPAAALPIDWMALDTEERVETLGTLGEWVLKIVAEFGLSEQVVPRCWYRHPAMIHELLALFQYRQQQFNREMGPPPSAPIDFEYYFALWRGRMRELTTDAGCTASRHYPQLLPDWADPDATARSKWEVSFDEYLEELAAEAPIESTNGELE